MKQKFVSNLVLLLLLNLIIKPFYILGIDAGVQNAVGAKDYGLYFALFNLSFLLNILSDLGITNFNNRNIAQHRQLLDKHFSKLVSLRMVLIIFYVAITAIVGMTLGYSKPTMILLGWILVNQSLASFLLYLRSNLAGLHLFKQDSIISVLDRFLLILFCGYALWIRSSTEPFKIEWFVWFQGISYAIAIIVAFIMVRSQVKEWKFEFSRIFSLSILKQSLPYALLVLLMGLYHRMDSVMLERMLPEGSIASGIYAQGFRFLDALNNFSFLFAVLLFPIFARMLKKKMDINGVLLVASKILFSGIIIISFTAYLYGFELMSWRYDENLLEASKTFMVLISSALFFGVVLIFGTLLTADGKLKALNYIAISGVVINFILNYVLIPKHQAYGSAVATLITQGITALAHLLLAKKVYKLPINWVVIGKLIFLSLFLVGFTYFSRDMHYMWMIKALTLVILSSLLAITIGLINISGLWELIKSKQTEDN